MSQGSGSSPTLNLLVPWPCDFQGPEESIKRIPVVYELLSVLERVLYRNGADTLHTW